MITYHVMDHKHKEQQQQISYSATNNNAETQQTLRQTHVHAFLMPNLLCSDAPLTTCVFFYHTDSVIPWANVLKLLNLMLEYVAVGSTCQWAQCGLKFPETKYSAVLSSCLR